MSEQNWIQKITKLFNSRQIRSTHNNSISSNTDTEVQTSPSSLDMDRQTLRYDDKLMLKRLSPVMREFVTNREVLFIEASDKHGRYDCSYRFIKPGFIRVLQDKYLLYPENRSGEFLEGSSNIIDEWQINMVFVDCFENTVGLHISGKSRLIKNEDLVRFRNNFTRSVIDEIYALGKNAPKCWVMIEIEEAYMHCSEHIPLLKKVMPETLVIHNPDVFQIPTVRESKSLSSRSIDWEMEIQTITESVTTKLLLDDKLSRFLNHISLQVLLIKQRFFLKMVLGIYSGNKELPENIREFYRQQTDANLDNFHLDIAIEHLNKTLVELNFAEADIVNLIKKLKNNENHR